MRKSEERADLVDLHRREVGHLRKGSAVAPAGDEGGGRETYGEVNGIQRLESCADFALSRFSDVLEEDANLIGRLNVV